MNRYFESYPKTWLHGLIRGWKLVLRGEKAIAGPRPGVTNPKGRDDLQVTIYDGMN
jgi:hypothetical protein